MELIIIDLSISNCSNFREFMATGWKGKLNTLNFNGFQTKMRLKEFVFL